MSGMMGTHGEALKREAAAEERHGPDTWAKEGKIPLSSGPCFCYVLQRNKMNAVMTNFDIDTSEAQRSRKWEGLSELDQAIRDNRLVEYKIKKSWADPWGRKLTIAVLVVIAAGFSYLAGGSFGLW